MLAVDTCGAHSARRTIRLSHQRSGSPCPPTFKPILNVEDHAPARFLEPVDSVRLVQTVEGFINGRLKARSAAARAADNAWIVTDATGRIQEISASAAKLLNLSARGAIGRNLPTFFIEDRPKLLAELLRAAEGVIIERDGVLQPRDRRPVRVHVDMAALPHAPGERVRLRWSIERDSPTAE
jgi:PAS domain S-box-containing protein